MMTTASTIFSFLAQHDACCINRYEVASASFGQLRRNLGSIIRILRDSQDDEACEISDQMRVLLFTWLTSPVEFNEAILDALGAFGEPTRFEMRWGLDGQYRAALTSAEDMRREGSPLRSKLRTVFDGLRAKDVPFRIFCHRKARAHFDTIFNQPFEDDIFLHTVRDYRNSEPFGALVKVGPLRSAGWESAPDALVSAPRFENLVQVVWSGCADEAGFGYDPVAPSASQGIAHGHSPISSSDALVNNVAWKRSIDRSGTYPGATFEYKPEEDEFTTLREPSQPYGKRRAVLVEIEDGDGILFPPNSPVLSFDPGQDVQSIALRPVGLLTAGMFVILARIGDVDFGDVLASEGRYACIWKERLREEMAVNPEAICRLLRNKGVALRCLPACVEHWCKPSTTVIHAPQQRQHFKMLIDVLAIDEADNQGDSVGVPWWQKAWNEIRISRGEAIQTGVQGHGVVEQQSLVILNSLLADIQKRANAGTSFRIPIPDGQDLSGGFVFHLVHSTEEGFEAPDNDLKVVRDLSTIDKWRVV